jgi:hypothetical protein
MSRRGGSDVEVIRERLDHQLARPSLSRLMWKSSREKFTSGGIDAERGVAFLTLPFGVYLEKVLIPRLASFPFRESEALA